MKLVNKVLPKNACFYYVFKPPTLKIFFLGSLKDTKTEYLSDSFTFIVFYVCEILPVTLCIEVECRVSENKVRRTIYAAIQNGVTGSKGKSIISNYKSMVNQ